MFCGLQHSSFEFTVHRAVEKYAPRESRRFLTKELFRINKIPYVRQFLVKALPLFNRYV